MYYIEKIENGKLYYRMAPTSDWYLIDYTKLLDRLIAAENLNAELKVKEKLNAHNTTPAR